MNQSPQRPRSHFPTKEAWQKACRALEHSDLAFERLYEIASRVGETWGDETSYETLGFYIFKPLSDIKKIERLSSDDIRNLYAIIRKLATNQQSAVTRQVKIDKAQAKAKYSYELYSENLKEMEISQNYPLQFTFASTKLVNSLERNDVQTLEELLVLRTNHPGDSLKKQTGFGQGLIEQIDAFVIAVKNKKKRKLEDLNVYPNDSEYSFEYFEKFLRRYYEGYLPIYQDVLKERLLNGRAWITYRKEGFTTAKLYYDKFSDMIASGLDAFPQVKEQLFEKWKESGGCLHHSKMTIWRQVSYALITVLFNESEEGKLYKAETIRRINKSVEEQFWLKKLYEKGGVRLIEIIPDRTTREWAVAHSLFPKHFHYDSSQGTLYTDKPNFNKLINLFLRESDELKYRELKSRIRSIERFKKLNDVQIRHRYNQLELEEGLLFSRMTFHIEYNWRKGLSRFQLHVRRDGRTSNDRARAKFLNEWMDEVKSDWCDYEPLQLKALVKEGFIISPNVNDWIEKYLELLSFAEHHGHIKVPRTRENMKLHNWLNKQPFQNLVPHVIRVGQLLSLGRRWAYVIKRRELNQP